METAESSSQAAPVRLPSGVLPGPCSFPTATRAMPAKAANNPSCCRPVTDCLRRSAAKTTTKTGMLAEIMVPTDADVPLTPNACATWPRLMPSTPSAAMGGSARHGMRSFPMTRTRNSGTATTNRIAVKVRGGTVWSPSFVAGMERPHMTASRSIAAMVCKERLPHGRERRLTLSTSLLITHRHLPPFHSSSSEGTLSSGHMIIHFRIPAQRAAKSAL